jgi:hypothetical protein
MKRKRNRSRSLSVLLAISVAAGTTTLPREARADVAILGVLDVIGKIYGGIQAGQALLSLFGVGNSTTMSEAVAQLKSFMQTYRDQSLVANVNSDLQLFQTISSDYMNGLTDGLESNFITFSERDFSQLESALQNGDMTDAYMLGPAFNLLGATLAGGFMAFGAANPANAYPQSIIDNYLNQILTTDYGLVGGITVNMDVACSAQSQFSTAGSPNELFDWTQSGKKMWPKYGTSTWWHYTSPPWHYVCDFTQSCNTVSNSLSCCLFYTRGPGATVQQLDAATRAAALATLDIEREAFLADQSVGAVRAGMTGAASVLDTRQSTIVDVIPGSIFPCTGHVVF